MEKLDFYEHLIGVAYSTYSISGFLDDSVLLNGFVDSISNKQSQCIKEIIDAVEENNLQELFLKLKKKYDENQNIKKQIIEKLARKINHTTPKLENETKSFMKALDNILGSNWFPLMFSEPELSTLSNRNIEIAEELLNIRNQIVKNILVICPELIESKYLDPRENNC